MGKKPVFPNMGRDYKAECGILMVVTLEAYLHCSSELEADSLHLPGSLWVWGIPTQPEQHHCEGNEEDPAGICDAGFLFYWFMACGQQLARASNSRGPASVSSSSASPCLAGPLPESSVKHTRIGCSGHPRKTQLFPPTLASCLLC